MNWHKDGYTITTDTSKVDIPYVHGFLSNSYWAAGIPVETVKRSVDGSLCFCLLKNEQQIGFARVITDKATFGYLADVFIDENYRGQGLSKWLVDVILHHPDLQGLRRMMLATRDAHDLYRKFGFSSLTFTDRWMNIHNPDVYKKIPG